MALGVIGGIELEKAAQGGAEPAISGSNLEATIVHPSLGQGGDLVVEIDILVRGAWAAASLALVDAAKAEGVKLTTAAPARNQAFKSIRIVFPLLINS